MDLSALIPIVVSVLALALGIANYVGHRRDSRRMRRREADALVDKVSERLARREGRIPTKALARDRPARRLLDRALDHDPSNPQATRYRGYVHWEDDEPDDAKRCFERLLKADETRWHAYVGLGDIADKDGRLHFYERAAACAPRRLSAEPLTLIANAHVSADNPDQAVIHFQRALEADPGYVDAHVGLAGIHKENGDLDRAVEHYKLAIDSHSPSVDAMVQLGALLTQQEGKWDEGLMWIEAASRQDPTDSYPLRYLAAVYADAKKPDEALHWRDRAIAVEEQFGRTDWELDHDLVTAMRELQRIAKAE